MPYQKGDICPTCGTPVVKAWVNIGFGSYFQRFLCPSCREIFDVEYVCKSCHKKIKTKATAGYTPYGGICQKCLLKRETKKTVNVKKIPSWRLNMDDASEDEILSRPASDFGMKPKSYGQWQEYYKSPHEVSKQKEFEENKKKMARELLG